MDKLISITVLIASLLPYGTSYGSSDSFAASDSRCRVLEVIRIHSRQEFTCRVDRWKGIDNLRLRVTIRNVSIPEEVTAREQAMEWLRSHLESSRYIILRNIEPRNYFRVVADVQTDRVDLLEGMLKKGLIRPQESVSEKQLLTQVPPLNGSFQNHPPSKDIPIPLDKRQSKPLYSKAALEKVLSSEIDLSGLDSNASLREALEMIRLSVDPPLPMVIVWNDLQQTLLLDPETPIGVGGLTKIPLKLAIELILSSVSSGAERPVVLQENTVLLIVSSRFAAGRMNPGVYNISELAGIPVFVDEYSSGVQQSPLSNSGGSGR